MLSILDRYFLRELSLAMAATAVVLLTIFAGTSFAHVLQQVANGSFPASVMFQVLGLNMVEGLSNLLPLAAFLGLLQGLGRMYRESEMHVLASSGMGLRGLLRPVAMLGLITALLVAVVSMWLGPWAMRTSNDLIVQANRSVIAAGLNAGQFTDLPGRTAGIIFVDELSRNGRQLGRTFLATERVDKQGRHELKIVSGAHGRLYQESNGGGRFLELSDGWQYEIPLDDNAWRAMKYQLNDASLSNLQSSDDDDDPVLAMRTLDLARSSDPLARSELAERTTVPMMVLVLMMLALPMSRQSPREPRYGRLLLAVLAFFVYHAMLAICRAQISKGHWHNAASMWLIDLLIFGLAGWAFARQYRPRRRREVAA
ncbi:LPS export ABC transporter permease LptF [Frateuria aurantia]|uniref:Lipopolysaccharide export system permease protein LptF n=1 Tax=Frateuria aurantia (strain ATCC 33424 / DSM 6220 / KCTC 2777 / LMG 1558 / NBRC 3245 / NCIMB 13370) TaxID=767434 RepID=H8L699_FRAAD|nr:LPS export ABC transporter permease LptF [Frateuria aurantia]AFC86776.1 putative permease [Frateuria aurantia DSM 6220]